MLDEMFTGAGENIHPSYAVVIGLAIFLVFMVILHKVKGPFGKFSSVVFTGAVFLLGASSVVALKESGLIGSS